MKDACEADCYDPESSRIYVNRFIKRMNQEAAKLKLTNTSFSNSHGLSDKATKSTAQDVIRLTQAGLKFPLFCEITKKFVYDSRVVFDFFSYFFRRF
jgi:D-alanyl-D-alanine carboxypeptidase